MREHAVAIIDGGVGKVCLGNGWKTTAINVAHPDASMNDLIARIERQREIIGDLLVKNEQLRNRLRRMEHNSQSSLTQRGEFEAAE